MVLVSVVIATLGNKKELIDLVKTIHNLKRNDIEVIVVDNGAGAQFPMYIARNYHYVKVITMPNNTGMFAYNVGFINARGKFIFLLDDDCVINKSTISNIVKRFSKEPVSTGVVTINIYDPKQKYYSTSHLFQLKSPYVPTFAGGASMFRREVFEKVGYFDEDFFCWQHEDDLSIKIADAGYRIYFDREIVLYHDEKFGQVRKLELLLTGRNKVWFYLKHFSWFLIPLNMARDILWIITPLNKPLLARWYAICGYLWGWLSLITPLRKRKVASFKTQIRYIKYYLLGKYVGRIIREG